MRHRFASIKRVARILWLDPLSRRHLVRILTDKGKRWEKADLKPEDAARAAFTFSPTEGVSTFMVRNPQDEVAAVAAHLLGRQTSLRVPLHVLRIPTRSIRKRQITAIQSMGITGVMRVDKLHVDLYAVKQEYVDLGEELLDSQRSGADRVRRITGEIITHQLQKFAQLGREEIGVEAQRAVQRYLSSSGA